MVSPVAPPRPIGELAGPSGRRWSGNLGAFESDRLHFLLRAKAEFGGLVRFDDLTSIVNDPQLAVHILLDREQLYAIRENFRGEVLTPEQITETRQLRPTLNPGLRRSRAVRVVPSVASRMETELRQATGSCVDPLPMLERAAARSIASYYFGRDADVVLEGTRELLDALESHFGNPLALPAAWHTPGRRRILKRHHRLESIVVPLLRDRAQGHASQDQ
ncbi:MAG: putative cytochrome hydroxylase, partial [Marmoricola sp.]|nr:putative cytochrome hydroxylase [Marmoricola sp.]